MGKNKKFRKSQKIKGVYSFRKVLLCLEEQFPWKMEFFVLCNLQQTITLQLLQRYSNFPSQG